MRLTRGIRAAGMLLLLILLVDTRIAAHDTPKIAADIVPALSQQQVICTEVASTPERAVQGEAGDEDNGTPVADTEIELAGTPVPDVLPGVAATPLDKLGTPVVGDATPAPGTGVVQADIEGFLCQDMDGDGSYEVGFDEDGDGMLAVDEVLGTDLDNDGTITEDEFDPEAVWPAQVAPAEVGAENALTDDETLDATDEGYVREDIDGDGAFEIGIDIDANGTLSEDEVVGTDLNNDEVLTEEEFGT